MNKYKDYNRALQKGYWCHELKNCIDITEEWLGNKKNKQNIIIKHKIGDTFKYKGKEYYIDGHDIVIEYKTGEEELAEIISKYTNKRVELFPRFNIPENFKSTDAKIGKEYIDFKITTSGTDKFMFNNINEAKEQSKHFIFWIKNKKIPNDVIKYQIDDIFRRLKNIQTVGYYRSGKIIIYKRK